MFLPSKNRIPNDGRVGAVTHLTRTPSDTSANEYEAITCQACTRIHLNRKTAKLLGQEDE
jgi:hypothetical protein